MRSTQYFTFALLLLASIGCQPKPEQQTLFRPEANFESYKTYGWSENRIRTSDKWLNRQRLDSKTREFVDQKLTSAGYRQQQSNLERPDFLISYEAVYFREWRLILRVYDTELRRTVWESQIAAFLESYEGPDDPTTPLYGALTDLLAEFPPDRTGVPGGARPVKEIDDTADAKNPDTPNNLDTTVGNPPDDNTGEAAQSNTTAPVNADGEVTFTGVVRKIELEGGFFGIETEGNPVRKYQPISLGDDFNRDGLRVTVTAKIRDDVVTIQQWGTPIEIVKIELVEDKSADDNSEMP